MMVYEHLNRPLKLALVDSHGVEHVSKEIITSRDTPVETIEMEIRCAARELTMSFVKLG